MRTPEYWILIRSIWDAPLATNRRRILADLLLDRNERHAANKQQEIARIIDLSPTMIYLPQCRQIWGHDRDHRVFRIKRDSNLVWTYKGFHWQIQFGPYMKIHYLRGKP